MRILGINNSHNAAACLYEDRRVSAASQEERLRQVKNWDGMHTEAIPPVSEMTWTSLDQLDFVAINGRHAAFPMTRDGFMEEHWTINNFQVTTRRFIRRSIKRALRPAPFSGLYRVRRLCERVCGVQAPVWGKRASQFGELPHLVRFGVQYD